MRASHKQIEVTGTTLFLCDMRPGFSEDGVEVPLPKGVYQLTLESATTGKLVGFRLVLIGQSFDREEAKGSFKIDMAQVGVLERRAFLKVFGGDGEALADWSDTISDKQTSKWGGCIEHKKSGLRALYVKIGSDCKCIVQLLKAKSRTVGVRVVPQPAPAPSAERRGSRYWTWVEVKCEGIKGEWSFCDDRDYEPDAERVLDNALFEISCLDEGDLLESLDADDIDADAPISKYRRKFKGISKIGVFVERAGKPRKRIPIPSTYKIRKMGAVTTTRQMANAVFQLFENARKWVQ